MKIVIPTFLLAIGLSAVQAKSVYLRADEADEKSQLARRKLRRALQTDSSMSLPELTQQAFGKAFKDAPPVAPEETEEEEVVDAAEQEEVEEEEPAVEEEEEVVDATEEEEEEVDAAEEEVATPTGKAAKEPEEAAEEVDDEEEVPAAEEEVADAPADEEEEEVPASDTPANWGTKSSKPESHHSPESGKAGKASHDTSLGDAKASKPESHHSVESEWSGSHHSVESEWSGSKWSGKSSKKSDLKDLIKFIVVKILVLLDIISFDEAAALSYSKPSLGLWSGKSGKSGHYGLTSFYSKPSFSSLFSGKSGKSGREDKEEEILELLGIFILWLESLDKTAVEGFISNIVVFLGSLDKAAIEGIIIAIVAFVEGFGLGFKATPATRDGHMLPGGDLGAIFNTMIIFMMGVMNSLPGAPWNAEKFSSLFDEILLLLANLPSKASGKSGKSGGHYYSKPSLSSLFSGKSGKSGLKDKKEDILELLGIFFLWLESLDKTAVEGFISTIVGFLGNLDEAAIGGIIVSILTALGVPGKTINDILTGLVGLIPTIGIAPEDSSVLTELQTEIAEEDLLIANLSMP